jgi:SNF family Na+-dependent transporter
MTEPVKDSWGSRLGVILAVAGSAVGLGNFIRFPGQAAQFGGGGFMIAYAISFLIIGLPICWAEWTMGRYAGQRGYNSAAGVFHCLVPWRGSKYVGVLGAIITLVIFMYYVVIEAWTLGYTVRFLRAMFDPGLRFTKIEESQAFFSSFVGAGGDGDALRWSLDSLLPWLVLAFAINLVLIYRGISAGIEKVCRIGMPILMVLTTPGTTTAFRVSIVVSPSISVLMMSLVLLMNTLRFDVVLMLSMEMSPSPIARLIFLPFTQMPTSWLYPDLTHSRYSSDPNTRCIVNVSPTGTMLAATKAPSKVLTPAMAFIPGSLFTPDIFPDVASEVFG